MSALRQPVKAALRQTSQSRRYRRYLRRIKRISLAVIKTRMRERGDRQTIVADDDASFHALYHQAQPA